MALDGPDNSMIIDNDDDGSFNSNNEFNYFVQNPFGDKIKVREEEDEPESQQYLTTKCHKPPRSNNRNCINNYHSYNGKEA